MTCNVKSPRVLHLRYATSSAAYTCRAQTLGHECETGPIRPWVCSCAHLRTTYSLCASILPMCQIRDLSIALPYVLRLNRTSVGHNASGGKRRCCWSVHMVLIKHGARFDHTGGGKDRSVVHHFDWGSVGTPRPLLLLADARPLFASCRDGQRGLCFP